MQRIDKFDELHKGVKSVFEIDSKDEFTTENEAQMILSLASQLSNYVVYTKKYINKATGVTYNEIPPTLPDCTIRYEMRLNFIKAYENKIKTLEGIMVKLGEEIRELKNDKQ